MSIQKNFGLIVFLFNRKLIDLNCKQKLYHDKFLLNSNLKKVD